MISRIKELESKTNIKEVRSICESAISTISNVIYKGVTSEARREIESFAIENLFEGLSKYANDPDIFSWLTREKRIYSIKNLGVHKAISILLESESKYEPTLKAVLEQYKELTENKPEVLLYESFISAVSGFSYLPSVQTELTAISSRVEQYKNDVDITKILETMKDTKSSYLIPLVEDLIDDYLNNKDEQSKNSLKEALVKFTYDPFIRDMLNLINLDATKLQLEYANSNCDISKIYSPIMYLGENETLFNVKGVFYVKKGNNISKLRKEDTSKLDKEFVRLCERINYPNIVINKDEIKIYSGNDTAVITEKSVLINEQEIKKTGFKRAIEVSKWVGNAQFYELVESLRENFDEIAEIDFAKRVYLKENEDQSADIFRLRDNIFINIHDTIMGKDTFYRNVNPIQAKNIMMEHLRFDVSKAFKDILPNQEKILSEINNTKTSYRDYIQLLEKRAIEIKSKSKTKMTEQVLFAINEELDSVKNEFKDYNNQVESYVRPKEELNEGVTIIIDVDGQKYIVPIPEKTSISKGESTDTEIKLDGAETSKGSVVGAENVQHIGVPSQKDDSIPQLQPAENITFDDRETELLGNNPTIDTDKIDLGAEEVEKEVDQTELEKEKEEELKIKSDKNDETEPITDVSQEIETNPEETETTSNIDQENTISNSEEGEEGEEEEEEEEEEEDQNDEKKKKENKGKKEKNESLERTPFIKENLHPRVFIKKRINESAQIGDKVSFDKNKKGFITGQIGDEFIIQVQGSTCKIPIKDVRSIHPINPITKPHMKFDTISQKLLFEQFVRCGIFEGSVPIKTNNCFVRYSDWESANKDQQICVMIEGNRSFINKDKVRIFEDLNDFANMDNYIEGVIIDPISQEAIRNVMINAVDYTNSIGDAEMVRVIVDRDGKKTLEHHAKEELKTLSI